MGIYCAEKIEYLLHWGWEHMTSMCGSNHCLVYLRLSLRYGYGATLCNDVLCYNLELKSLNYSYPDSVFICDFLKSTCPFGGHGAAAIFPGRLNVVTRNVIGSW